MAGITTHVLDTTSGKPGAGMRIDFSEMVDGAYKLIRTLTTNADGRTDGMIMKPEDTRVGQYELTFHVEDYFRKAGVDMPSPAFIGIVPVRFAVFDPTQHYHVPMLATPWSCVTYRGS